MSCVSRALPDLHPAATRAAKHMQPHSLASQGHEGVRGKVLNLALTFTCHFRRWRTPHWGDVTGKCPGGLHARGDDPSMCESGLGAGRTAAAGDRWCGLVSGMWQFIITANVQIPIYRTAAVHVIG